MRGPIERRPKAAVALHRQLADKGVHLEVCGQNLAFHAGQAGRT